MKGNLVEALIGAAVLVVAALFLGFVYERAGVGPMDGYELVAKFDRADGIELGSDVRVSGIKVGTVVGQMLDVDSFQAVVTLTVRGDVHLPIDSSASITSEGLLGGSYLALAPGGMDEYLEDGDEIEFTQGAIDLMDLISKAMFTVPDEEVEGS